MAFVFKEATKKLLPSIRGGFTYATKATLRKCLAFCNAPPKCGNIAQMEALLNYVY